MRPPAPGTRASEERAEATFFWPLLPRGHRAPGFRDGLPRPGRPRGVAGCGPSRGSEDPRVPEGGRNGSSPGRSARTLGGVDGSPARTGRRLGRRIGAPTAVLGLLPALLPAVPFPTTAEDPGHGGVRFEDRGGFDLTGNGLQESFLVRAESPGHVHRDIHPTGEHPLALAAGVALSACGDPAASPLHQGYVQAADGVELYYRTVGDAPDTAVVLHGGPGFDHGYLAPDLEPLAESFTLFVYDQRGSGCSTLGSEPDLVNLEAHVADLDPAREHSGLERLAILGHSWGGPLAGQYALARPDRVSRLVLVSPEPIREPPYGEHESRARLP